MVGTGPWGHWAGRAGSWALGGGAGRGCGGRAGVGDGGAEVGAGNEQSKVLGGTGQG